MDTMLFKILLMGFMLGCTTRDNQTRVLTYEDFRKHLHAEMTYSSMVDTFGEPTKDIGSGIHIYVYALADSTAIWIGYTDQILYARHLDQQQKILHILM